MPANNSHGSGIPVFLSWSGADSKTVTPGASVSEQKSELRALQLKERDKNLAAMRIVVEAVVTVTQGGVPTAIAFDKLPKAISSLGVWLPEIGWVYPHEQTPGALHWNVNQVIGNGYRQRGIFDAAVPATASTAFTRTLRYELPFALPLLADELDTAMPMALLEGGKVEVKIAASDVFATDSTAAVLTSVVLRAWVETIPVTKMWVPGLFGFRQYSSGGAANSFRISGIGGLGPAIAEEGCSLGAFFALCNPTGLGLGGSTTADNFASLNSEDLDIPDLAHIPVLFEMFDRQLDTDNNQATRWPYSLAETVFGNGAVDGAMFLPIRMPTRGQFLTRLRRINRAKDIKLKYGFGSGGIPAGEMKHGTLEFYKGSDKLEAMVREAYKIDPRAVCAPKTESGKPLSEGALHGLRYGSRKVFYSGVAE